MNTFLVVGACNSMGVHWRISFGSVLKTEKVWETSGKEKKTLKM